MDIFSFVNSKDIRNYLREIHYAFDSLEVAWLIYNCRGLTYNQKKDAWNELIETMPDCETPDRFNSVGQRSLHETLKKYMEIYDRELEDFYAIQPSEKYVYMYSYLYRGDKSWTEEYETVFDSLAMCALTLKADVEELQEFLSDKHTDVVKYRFKRKSLCDPRRTFEVEYNADGEVLRIIHNTERTKEECDITDIFEGWWFVFPTPFKKGDIVWVPKEPEYGPRGCESMFVLEKLSTWNPSDFMRESGDMTDMTGSGYFANDDGTVYYEAMCHYMDLEYYQGQFADNEKILPALSKFLKGEISVDLLLCAYQKVLLNVALNDNMLVNWYGKDILE